MPAAVPKRWQERDSRAEGRVEAVRPIAQLVQNQTFETSAQGSRCALKFRHGVAVDQRTSVLTSVPRLAELVETRGANRSASTTTCEIG